MVDAKKRMAHRMEKTERLLRKLIVGAIRDTKICRLVLVLCFKF